MWVSLSSTANIWHATCNYLLAESLLEHSCTVRNHLEDIQLHYAGYGEPGYDDPSCGLVATGDWNSVDVYDNRLQGRQVVSDLPCRVQALFERMGIPCEWNDEWSTCDECGELVRTQPDGWNWTPSYKVVDDCEFLCSKCAAEREEDETEDETEEGETEEDEG